MIIGYMLMVLMWFVFFYVLGMSHGVKEERARAEFVKKIIG